MAKLRPLPVLAGVLGVGTVGILVLAGVVRASLFLPPDVKPEAVHGDAPPAPAGETLRVLVYNAQFAGTRRHHFFYDGGEASHVPPEDVEWALSQLESLVREADPDVVLWQELDRDSARTGRVDEVARLTTGWPAWTSASYHKAPYVPIPAHEPLGRVDLQLVTASRYGLTDARRHQLALLDEPFYRRALDLRRALLEAHMQLEGGGELIVMNTHLSAFSYGDGTLNRQMDQLGDHMAQAEASGSPWILAGDLNALPPGDDPSRLGDDAVWYADDTPVAPLLARYSIAAPVQDLLTDPSLRTYQPWGGTPDRTLDYMFYGGGLELVSYRVLQQEGADISDHLPVLAEFRLPGPHTVRPSP